MPSRKSIPFSVSRNDARTLLAQVTDGRRQAIVSGCYAPGDVLPSSRELARLPGASMIIAAPAPKRLSDGGLVLARPRIGTVVRDRGAKQWRGHVVFVGFSDTTCPPCAVYAACNELAVPDKAIRNGIGMTHSCRRDIYGELRAWLRDEAKGEP